MPETWYILEDGSAVDPSEVAPDKAGVLRHKGGAAVAMRGQVPSTRGVNVEVERAKAKLEARDMKADESRRPYRTRDLKAE